MVLAETLQFFYLRDNKTKSILSYTNGLEILDKSGSWPLEQNSYYVVHLNSVSSLRNCLEHHSDS